MNRGGGGNFCSEPPIAEKAQIYDWLIPRDTLRFYLLCKYVFIMKIDFIDLWVMSHH